MYRSLQIRVARRKHRNILLCGFVVEEGRLILYIVFLTAFLLLFGGVSTSTLVLMLLLSLLGVEYLSIILFLSIFFVLFSFSSRSSSGSTNRLTVR